MRDLGANSHGTQPPPTMKIPLPRKRGRAGVGARRRARPSPTALAPAVRVEAWFERGLDGLSTECQGLRYRHRNLPGGRGTVRIVVCIEDPDVIQKILAHLKKPHETCESLPLPESQWVNRCTLLRRTDMLPLHIAALQHILRPSGGCPLDRRQSGRLARHGALIPSGRPHQRI